MSLLIVLCGSSLTGRTRLRCLNHLSDGEFQTLLAEASLSKIPRPPTFCSRSCRQRAYEQRKWSRPHPVELLARDIASVRVRDVIRQALLGAGINPPPPPEPKRRRPPLRLVEK